MKHKHAILCTFSSLPAVVLSKLVKLAAVLSGSDVAIGPAVVVEGFYLGVGVRENAVREDELRAFAPGA